MEKLCECLWIRRLKNTFNDSANGLKLYQHMGSSKLQLPRNRELYSVYAFLENINMNDIARDSIYVMIEDWNQIVEETKTQPEFQSEADSTN